MSKSCQNVEDLYKHSSKIKKDFAIFITSCGKFCFDKKLLTSLYYFFFSTGYGMHKTREVKSFLGILKFYVLLHAKIHQKE